MQVPLNRADALQVKLEPGHGTRFVLMWNARTFNLPVELCFQRDCNHVRWYRVALLLVAEGMENTFRAVHKLVHHEKLVDSPKCVFHGEQLRGFDGGSR